MKCINQTFNWLLLNINNEYIETWLKIQIHCNSNQHKQWNTTIKIQFIPIQNKSVVVHVCFVLFIVCLYICVCECLLQNNNHKTKHKNNTICARSIAGVPFDSVRRFRASLLPWLCITCTHLCRNWVASCVVA